jgi:hypothetical protein
MLSSCVGVIEQCKSFRCRRHQAVEVVQLLSQWIWRSVEPSSHPVVEPSSLVGNSDFRSEFRDPHWKQNSDSVFDSEDSGQVFFLNSAVKK